MKHPFESFLTEAYQHLTFAQEQFLETYQINEYDSWHYDQPSGVFSFSRDSGNRYFAFQCIGSFSPEAETWLWSWANDHTYPHVRKASEALKEYGEQNTFPKLTEKFWKAEEADAWEMLAIAHYLLKPIGVYRIPTEGLYMFLIFTDVLSETEARRREDEKVQLILCNQHGLQRPAFICQHLDTEKPQGFHEAFDTWPDMALAEDDDFQAWCDACERIRIAHDGWNEEAEKHAGIKGVCESCYFEIKRINT
ncbi:MAG: DUF6882 domain-containing protein [Bacteroidota bacterium]